MLGVAEFGKGTRKVCGFRGGAKRKKKNEQEKKG